MGTALALAAACSPVAAATPPATETAADAPADVDVAAATDAAIVLVAGSLPWGIGIDELRARLAKEIGAEMLEAIPDGRSPRGTLFLDSEGSELVARFQSADGSVTERTVTLPRESARAMDTIVLLSGNVARDEAAELRGQLGRRGRASAEPSPSAGPARPAAAPDSADGADAMSSTGVAATARLSAKAAKTAQTEPAPALNATCAAARGQPTFWAGADFVPMLGTSLAARDAVLHLSLNVVGGLAGGIQGLQIGSAFNLVTGSICGLQIGGAVNVARRGAKGVQIAGAANGAGTVDGFQIAGGLNLAGEVSGAQIAGGLNVARQLSGVQITGGMNLAGGLSGVQIGAIDLVLGDVSGAQIGVLDLGREVRGAQIGVIDVASSVRGLQLGVLNVAGRVQGAQIGVLNVAEESDFSLGVVSIVKRGRLHMDVWGAETGLVTAALKHGGRYFHNFYGVGIRPLNGETRVAFTLGLGGHFPLSPRVFLDIDGLAYSIHRSDDFVGRTALLTQARSMLGLRLTDGLALLAGPSYNVSIAKRAEDAALSAIGSSALHSEPGLVVHGWPGVSVGVQAF